MNSDQEETYCQSCHTEGMPVKPYAKPYPSTEKRNLCDLCADTFIGNITGYPNLYDSDMQMMAQCMAQLAWKIIKHKEGNSNGS